MHMVTLTHGNMTQLAKWDFEQSVAQQTGTQKKTVDWHLANWHAPTRRGMKDTHANMA